MTDLRETTAFDYRVTLDEGEAGNRWLIVKGVSQRADAGNANKRVYPRTVLESAISNSQFLESIKARGVLGECDHPDDGKSSLKRISHIVLEATMLPNGDVDSSFLILNNPDGERLKELFRAGARVGVSSRGSGSVKPGNGQWSGYSVVQEDYRLSTWDFVVQPSTFGAYPTPTNESLPLLATEGAEATDAYDATYGAAPSQNKPTTPSPALTRMPAATGTNGVPSGKNAAEVSAEGHQKLGALGHDINTMPQASNTLKDVEDGTPEKSPSPEMCPFGALGCGNELSGCTCLSHLGKQKNEEDEHTHMETAKNKKSTRVVESLVRQNRITERIAAADRAASGRLFTAIVAKLRDIASTQAESTYGNERVLKLEANLTSVSECFEEATRANAILTAENIELKRVVATVKGKIAEAEDDDDVDSSPAIAVAAYVEGLVARDSDASDWRVYLLEATDLNDAKARHLKMKTLLLERASSIDLPQPGSKSAPLTESRKGVAVDAGVALFRRAKKSMGRSPRLHLGHTTNGIR